ncbi:MAG: bifunctional folylpolyglutamate synthase/dihydrofolate synthase [Clostridium sp.]|nr:bifunctional folylpolyglutamate synthase/dihydrofolate synthase [Acetatifactor muris]MCM1528117.1 bifunctional folylpolyglutamate synthase/dihydrofolate synthase [Bacteroides sp.]MCM1564176.1 bifunctional folylpolyglutamate synthase/dihydrofolate synthase [Clostridium sp.]
MERRTIDTFEAAVEYLYDMPRFTDKNTLEDTRAHLARLGSPDQRIRNVIHVAGTNGKGSVCAYLSSVLREAGFHTAVFTSPHLTDIRERFAVDGGMISKEDFLRVFLQVYNSLNWEELKKGEGYHPTFFEYLFLMAMLWFAERDPDHCILETGLGGRLDATNAVECKALTVITRISRDHVEYLGSSLSEIAGEKAGILREGVPLVYGDEVEEASAIFEERARDLRIACYPVSKKDYTFQKFHHKSIDFSLHTGYYGYIGVTLRTQARYQQENAALAVKAVEVLDRGRAVTAEHIIQGLARAFWPGRMEEVWPEVFADGAHNEDGIRAFLDTVRQDGCEDRGQGRMLLFGVVQDKDYRSMIRQVSDSALFDRIYAARMETGRTASIESLSALREWGGAETVFCEDVRKALRGMLSERRNERIYIAGSLYLVGEIKELLRDDQF